MNLKAEYDPFYDGYVKRLHGASPLKVLKEQIAGINQLRSIPEEKGSYAYAEGKWTVKELICHAIDTERIMAYRLLCISRGEEQGLLGFDENIYAQNSNAARRTLSSFIDEFETLRRANLFLFESLDESDYIKLGKANNSPVNVFGLLHIIAGHWEHHKAILKERYGLD